MGTKIEASAVTDELTLTVRLDEAVDVTPRERSRLLDEIAMALDECLAAHGRWRRKPCSERVEEV